MKAMRLKFVAGGLLAGFCVLRMASSAEAATHTWSGGGRDGLWSNPDNWSTAPPNERERGVVLVFPFQLRAGSRAINDLPGLEVVRLTLAGSNYELGALSDAHALTLAAGGTLICSGSSNAIAPSLRLQVENGIFNVAVSNAVEFAIRGAITGPGSLTKSGPGTLRIEGTAANTFARLYATGGVALLDKPSGTNALGAGLEIHPGATVRLSASHQVPDTAEVVLFPSSLLALPLFDLDHHDETVAAISGTGVIDLGDTVQPLLIFSGELVIDQPAGTRIFSGPIHGAGGTVVKRGEGVLSLNHSLIPAAGVSGTCSEFRIEAGEVYFNRPWPNTVVNVTGPARIGGTRTPAIAGASLPAVGNVRMMDGAFAPNSHAQGAGTEPLASRSIDLAGPARFVARIVSAGSYHRVNATGGVLLNQPVLDLSVEYQPAVGDSFVLIQNDGVDLVQGYFAGLPEGAAIEANGQRYRVSYRGHDGNDVTLTRVGATVVNPPPGLSSSLQPEFEGGPVGLNLHSLGRAAERFNVEANENLADRLGWHWIGEAVADEFGGLHFNDPDRTQPQRFYRFARSPMSPVVDPLPAVRFIPVASLAPELLAAVQEHLVDFGPSPGAPPGADAQEWSNAEIVPTATLVFDPMYQAGEQPAYAELRIALAGHANSNSPPQGYVLVSLTDEDSPIVEFATHGATKTERLLQRVGSGSPHKIFRFSSGYWSVENSAGQFLGEYGTPPSVPLAGAATGADRSGRLTVNPTNGQWEVTPIAPLQYAPTFDYAAMKQAFVANPAVANFRLARSQISSAHWSRLRGRRLPRLTLAEGQTSVFLESTPLNRVRLELEPEQPPIADLRLRSQGGFSATGLRAGTAVLRAVTASGQPLAYTLVVTRTGLGGGPEFTVAGCPSSDVDVWYAGTGWDGDQRHYRQLKDEEEWCPVVGCGPTALAMLLGWWDVNGVPSAFYKLNSGRGNALHFRFNFESLRNSDAPKTAGEDQPLVRAVYEDLHELCNTFCVSGQGATAPDQLAAAFAEYMFRVAASFAPPRGEFGGYFVVCHPEASWNDFFLVGGTDWEGGGKAVAEGIKAGRPGLVGIWNGITPHYVVAYGYKRVEKFENCEEVELRRWFKCNMGWGPGSSPEWHDAEAVWFGLTANMWQNNLPTKPLNYVGPPLFAQLFHPDLDPARCAAVMDDAGSRLDLFFIANRALPGTLEHLHSANAATTWYVGLDANLSAGLFRSSPAAMVSTAGSTIELFGRGMDRKIWSSRSLNGGTNFNGWLPMTYAGGALPPEFASAPAVAGAGNTRPLHVLARHEDQGFRHTRLVSGASQWTAWQPVSAGLFNSAPAVACSGDGQKVFAFGRGLDNGIWWAYSLNAGTNWTGWARIGEGTVFSSEPAAAASADGNVLHVVARGLDNAYWRVVGLNLGSGWGWGTWGSLNGVFSSGPAVVCSGDGLKVHIFGRGWPPPPPPPNTLPNPNLPRFYRNYSANAGASWAGWGEIVPNWELTQ